MLKATDSVQYITGVGPKKASLYNKLGIYTVKDIIMHIPRDYVDMRHVSTLDELEDNEYSSKLVRAKIIQTSRGIRAKNGLQIFKFWAEVNSEPLEIIFYNMRFVAQSLKVGQEYYFYGPIKSSLIDKQMICPEVVTKENIGGFRPIYPQTQGLSSKVIAKDINNAIKSIDKPLEDCVKDDIAVLSLWNALLMLHNPQDLSLIEEARERISFEKLYIYSAAMILLKGVRQKKKIDPIKVKEINKFISSLPYAPTDAQSKAIEEIINDMASGKAMNRLVQGDVGCGKTLISAAASYCAINNGMQVALMAPTEILVEQHYKTFSKFFEKFDIKIALLTGSSKAKDRKEINEKLQSGEINLLIGTHALFQDGVEFNNLGLVVTDEQHRFGVNQRAQLSAKGADVHTLVMSATPIPRTLALVIYGDLDISVVNELPKGRKEISTYVIDSSKLARALNFIKQHVEVGEQAYIVCPLVEESEDNSFDLKSATTIYKELSEGILKECNIGLLHGKMKANEKENIMKSFASGQLQILVATTVIEVGVDVPNSTIIMIENAERFGLSQLHQLRGRVGRGKKESYCILVSDSKTSKAKERLNVIKSTNDGFRIANEDLRLRGPGEILGVSQSGIGSLTFVTSNELLEKAQQTALNIVKEDPNLSKDKNKNLKNEVNKLIDNIGNIAN